MIAFEHGWVAWLALPWLLFWWAFARIQKRSLCWVDANVSDRFRRTLTIHSGRSLRWHLCLLLAAGLLLIAAGTRPTTTGRAELVPQGGRVLLLFDGSASMNANDVEGFSPEGEDPPSRFETARVLAFDLVHSLDDVRFGVASFSGVATVHLPVTGDRALVEESLRTVEYHNFYQNTGSSFTLALDTVLKYVDEESPDLQVVLFSDGEPPFEEDYDDALQALVEREIPVHTVAIGSLEGQGRLIYDYRDVVAGKEERTVLREYHTRRVDRHLQKMSAATGGRFSVAAPGVAEELADTIRTQPVPRGRVEDESARTDLSRIPLAAFLVCFLLDGLVIGHGRRRPVAGFDVERIGGGPPPQRRSQRAVSTALLVLVLVPVSGCGNPLWRAHVENERGVLSDATRRHGAARPFYERSIGYRARAEIPAYNLARSVTLEGDYSEAHDLYQEALQLEPGLAEAYYNDGVALFLWGEGERDPRGCELDRTFDLWHKALRRFATATEMTSEDDELGARARANREFLSQELEAMEDLLAHPPPECSEPPPPPPSGGGQSEDPPPPSSPPPPAGGDDPPPPPPPPPPPDGEDPQPPPPSGSPPPPPPGQDPNQGEPPPSSPPQLTGDELEEIQQALARIDEQKQEEGKYFRQTGPEQFGKESWDNPASIIWW